jgi:type I restriction enzyme S subunit
MPFLDLSASDERAFHLKEGDFLFARSGTIGRFGIVRNRERAVFASYLIRFRFKQVEPEFMRFALASKVCRESLISALHGGANQNVHAENIKEQSLAFPPLPEQRDIASFLGQKTVKIDALINRIRDQLGKLREYRTALISAAVTGKIDVREEAA